MDRAHLLKTYVQDVPPQVFESLGANDVLLIDSSHVARAGGDVNYLFFDVLPRLAAGVHVHIHDVFYPFEYPPPWVEERRWAWSETYVLRAFLQYNTAFEVRFFNKLPHPLPLRCDRALAPDDAQELGWKHLATVA